MYQFVDCSDKDADIRQCAFLNTIDDKFIDNEFGSHTFDYEDIETHPESARLLSLIPDGFFS